MKPINLAVVDDHTIMRKALVDQITAGGDINVIISAKNGEDFLQKLGSEDTPPEIATIDLSMPTMDGFTLMDELQKEYPQILVLVLSGFSSEFNIACMINKGIRGYLTKDGDPDDLKDAILAIHETGYYYSKIADERTFKAFQGNTIKSYNIPDREMEFIKLCCSEMNYDEIAEEMGISFTTVNGFRERVFERLDIHNRVALVLFAVRSGIVNDDFHRHNNLKFKS